MNKLLEQLAQLDKSKSNSIEQSISFILLPFISYLPPKLNDSEFNSLETPLLNLLKLKKGSLSKECSMLIGSYLVELYKREKSHRFWNLLKLASNSPSSSVLFAISYVIKKIGHSSKSSLQALSNQVCSLKEPLVYSALYTLRQLIQVCGDSISKTIPSAFKFASNYVYSTNETVQIIAIKILYSIIRFDLIPTKKHLSVADKLFKYTKTTSSLSTASKYVAILSAYPIIQKKLQNYYHKQFSTDNQSMQMQSNSDQVKEDDFTIQASKSQQQEVSSGLQQLQASFSILQLFKDQDKPFSIIFKIFLNFLDPKFISKHIDTLVNFTLTTSPSDVHLVLSLFGSDVHQQIFSKITNLKNTQNQASLSIDKMSLSLIKSFIFDDSSATAVAQIAIKRINSETNDVCNFFSFLTTHYPNVAKEQLIISLQNIVAKSETAHIYGLIAAIIISSSETTKNYEQIILQSERENLLKNALSASSSLQQQAAVLYLISALPSSYFNQSITKIWEASIKNMKKLSSSNSKQSQSFIQAVLISAAVHKSKNITKVIAENALHVENNLTMPGSLALIELCAHWKLQAGLQVLFDRLSKTSISADYLQSRFPYFSMNNNQIIEDSWHYIKLGKPIYGGDDTMICTRLCDLAPFFSNGDVKFLASFLKLQNKQVSALVINSICEKAPSSSFVPLLIKTILTESQAKQTSDFKLPILYDALGHLKALNSIKDIPSLDLIGSLSKYSQLSEPQVSSFLKTLETSLQSNDSLIIPSGLRALASIYETQGIQLMTLQAAPYQCNLLFKLLPICQSNTLQFTLLGQAVIKLLPCLMPFLSTGDPTDPTPKMLQALIKSISYSPLSNAKTIYADILRNLAGFAPSIAKNFLISYPLSPLASTDIRLTCCGAMADMLHSEVLSYDQKSFSLIPQVLFLLQRTNDLRAQGLAVSICESFSLYAKKNPSIIHIRQNTGETDEFRPWFRICKQILSQNLMVGVEASIQPKTSVKKAALLFLKQLLPLLSNTLVPDCLDDLMTSLIRAMETQCVELLSEAFPLLESVIKTFKDTRTESDCKILDLYGSQFTIAIRLAFPLAVNVAAPYLSAYLDFSKGDPSLDALLDTIVNGLQKIHADEAGPGYYAVSSYLCMICRSNEEFSNRFSEFLSTLPSILEKPIHSAFYLRLQNSEWAEASEFRTNYSSFYRDLLVSFLWLLSRNIQDSNTRFEKMKIVTAFALFELSSSSEYWRINAAFDTLSVSLELFSEEMKNQPQLLRQIVIAGASACQRNNQLDSTSFLVHSVKFLQNDPQLWPFLAYLATLGCNAFALGHLILAGDPRYSLQFASIALDLLQKKKSPLQQIVAVFTILFEKSTDLIPEMISLIINVDDDSFKLKVLKRALRRLNKQQTIRIVKNMPNILQEIGKLCSRCFSSGGNDLIGYLMLKVPDIGIPLFSNHIVTKCVMRAEEGSEKDALEGLKLLSLSLTQFMTYFDHENLNKIIKEIAKAALNGMKEKGDNKKSKDGMENAASLFKLCVDADENAAKLAYEEMSNEDKESLKKSLERMQICAQRPVAVKLTLFSNNIQRKRRTIGSDDEDGDESGWQNLDE